MFPDIISANISDHIIDVDVYDEAFAYFVDKVERIIQVLEDEATPIEEFFSESEEEEKTKEVEDSSKGSDEDLYTGSQIIRRPPPTVSNTKKCVGNGLVTWWIGQNS